MTESNDPNDTADLAAKSFRDAQVKSAKERIASFDFNADQILKLIENLSHESLTARVVVFGSYVEQMSIDLFKLHMRPLTSRAEHERVFGSNGPLGSFSARIEMAYMLRWIPFNVRENLHVFRKIRNLFAHEAYRVDARHPKVMKLFGSIAIDAQGILERMNTVGDKPLIKIEALNLSDRMLLALLFAANEAFEAMLCGPVALAFNIEPSAIMDPWIHQPKNLQSVRSNVVEAVVALAWHAANRQPRPPKPA